MGSKLILLIFFEKMIEKIHKTDEECKKILTPEQLSQWKSQCDASKAKASGGCPFMNSQKKS